MGEHFYCKFENWMCKLVAGLKIARVKISGVKIAIMKISGMKITGMKITGMKITRFVNCHPIFSLISNSHNTAFSADFLLFCNSRNFLAENSCGHSLSSSPQPPGVKGSQILINFCAVCLCISFSSPNQVSTNLPGKVQIF